MAKLKILHTLSPHSADAHARSSLPATSLVSDKVRKKIGQNAEKSQSRYAVSGENPRAPAFMRPADRGLLGKRLLGKRLLGKRLSGERLLRG